MAWDGSADTGVQADNASSRMLAREMIKVRGNFYLQPFWRRIAVKGLAKRISENQFGKPPHLCWIRGGFAR